MKSSQTSSNKPKSTTTRKQLSLTKESLNQPIGKLWYIQKSPFSLATRAAIHLSGRQAEEVTYIPVLSAILLWFRLRFQTQNHKKITAPIMQIRSSRTAKNGLYLRDSFDIAKYADEEREPWRQTLFPNDKLEQISQFNQHAQNINCFGRAMLTSRLKDNPVAAQQYIPRFLRNRFFSGALMRISIMLFRRKYKIENEQNTRDVARSSLEVVRNALASYSGEKLRHVCGERLTYADIILAESIFFDPERHGRVAELFKDEEFGEAFPDLIAWSRAVRTTYYGELIKTQDK